MVFSSYGFLFIFMPVFFGIYFVIKPEYRNPWLLLASLTFYYLGEGDRILILAASIAINFFCGYLIGWSSLKTGPRFGILKGSLLFAGVAANLGLLGYFKYVGFINENANALLQFLGAEALLPSLGTVLPLGISFFAFQGISYLADVYRGVIRPTSSLLTFATYKAMFPQLIAGPIVRYVNVADQLIERRVSHDAIMEGIARFCRGLAKKVLIADTVAQTADTIFKLPDSGLDFGLCWLGAIAYGLQIYFDFSAYSDMAIGMGRMMGFTYPENFNYPYTATSIRDFWRRWHMTLAAWFRDYVYIVLGGNRRGTLRTSLNLLVVFFLVGLWHGAAWTFVVWGLWHGLFMIVERRFDPDRWPVPLTLRRLYVVLVVIIGWVLFRADSFAQAWGILLHMFGLGTSGADALPVAAYLDAWTTVMLVGGCLFSVPSYGWLRQRIPTAWRFPLGNIALGGLLFLAGLKILAGAYSPFLYFRF